MHFNQMVYTPSDGEVFQTVLRTNESLLMRKILSLPGTSSVPFPFLSFKETFIW
jgi:hypothetical protein